MNKKEAFFIRLKERLVNRCSECDKTGWVNDETMCKCLKKFEFYIELDEAGVDREYWDLSFDDWRGDEVAKHTVVEYIDNLKTAYENGLGFVFHGSNGTGKTLLSCLILKSALEGYHYSIRFVTMAELTRLMGDKMRNEERDQFYEKKVKNSDFLVVDNLGSEYRPANFGSLCMAEFDILARYRRRNLFPTFLTTELNPIEFVKTYGSSLNSLFSSCNRFISVAGKDHRVVQGQEFSKKLRGLD